MALYDWLIIGAGPQGRFIASAIARVVPACRIALMDPATPMAAWHRRAAATGMQYLRSSNAHHLGQSARSLHHYLARSPHDARDLLGYYRRPSLALFNAHAEAELADIERVTIEARHITPTEIGWQVDGPAKRSVDTSVAGQDPTRAHARHVVMATGPGQPYRPPGLATCEHVFDGDFELGPPGPATAIVGGGITGAQLALRASQAGHRVAWITRRAPEVADFDSAPAYAGPRGMTPFLAASRDERTALLSAARYPGTLPPDVHGLITAALAAGQLDWIQGDPVDYHPGHLRLADGRVIAASRVILATGFGHATAPDTLLGQTMAALGVGDDGQGHAWLDHDLQLAPGLHVAGRAASLVLGPMAGNIKGARTAGARLAALAWAETADDTPAADTKKPVFDAEDRR